MNKHRMTRGLLVALLWLGSAVPALAQDAVGGQEAPAAPAGEAPAAPAVYNSGMQAGGARPAMLNQKTFTLQVNVRQVGAQGEKAPVKGASVLLEAFAGQAKVKTYNATSDERGVATFGPLTAIQGVRYLPRVTHEGVNFPGAALIPEKEVESLSIDIYGKTYEDSALRVTDLLTFVDLWEGYLVITQMWSLQNGGDKAFDPNGAKGDRYLEGLPLTLPVAAQGVQATIIKDGSSIQARAINNRVLLDQAVPPSLPGVAPLRVQVRYSIPLESPSVDYEQPTLYPVERAQVAVSLDTRFEKVPTLNVKMDAPGFPEVETSDNVPGMQPGRRFLVARGARLEAGQPLRFSLDGYPIPEPFGVWIMVLAAGLIFLVGGWLYRQETGRAQGRTARTVLLKALHQEREELFEALRDLEDRFDEGELSERRYDMEAAQLRERLALVLRRIQQEEQEARR